MLKVSLMVPFHLLGPNNQKEMQYDFFGHVISLASSMAQLHLYSQDNQNEVQQWHWSWHHTMSMASKMAPLHPLDQTKEIRCNMTFFWCHVMPMHLHQHQVMGKTQ